MNHSSTNVESRTVTVPDQALLEALVDHSELLIVVLDLEGRVVNFNHACEMLTGFSAAEIVGRPIWTTLIPGVEVAAAQNATQRLSTEGLPSTFVSHWLTSDGQQRLLHWRNTTLLDPDGKPQRILGTGIDITYQEQAEAKRQHGAQQLRKLIDTLPGLVARLDRDFHVRFINVNSRHWFGLDTNAEMGKHIRDVIGDGGFNVLRPGFAQALAGSDATYHGPVPYARGGTRFIHGTCMPSHDERGKIDGIYISALDITEQQALRQQLADEMRRGRTILDHAIDGTIIIDERGIIQHFNPAAERIFGYEAAAVLGHNVKLLMPEPVQSDHDDYIRRYLDTGEGRIIGSGRDVTGRHRDGSRIDLHLSIASFTENDETLFVGFTSDITARKAAERRSRDHLRELAHLDRRAGMNELTTGLAHELSQPLTAIRATAEAFLARLEKGQVPPESLSKALQQISLQAARAGEIIHSVRSFLRKDAGHGADAHDPNTMINTVLKLLSHEIETTGVKVVRNLNDNIGHCMAHRVQIEQVLFNLIHNAVEAMANTEAERVLEIESRFDADTTSCCITVTDSGPGIADGHFERLFDPFFTTRPQGLGQGLSICRSIVEQHGGTLTAANDPERGARFTLMLPSFQEGKDHDSEER